MPKFKFARFVLALLSFLLSAACCDAADRWSVVGPGGGGAQYLPTISPHNPSIAFVACDMTGSYLTGDAGASWRMFNLRSRTTLFVFDPTKAGTMYAYGLGLYRSVDGGRQWSLVYPDPPSVRRVASVGDHGEDELEPASGERITALAVDPAETRTLYATFVANRQTTLKVSTDWGKSWSAAGALNDGAQAIYIDPRSPAHQRTVYVAGYSRVVIRQGGVWSEGAPTPGGDFHSVSGGFPERGGKLKVYAATPEGVAFSADGGASWEELPLPEVHVRAVAASAHHPQFAYVSFSGLQRDGKEFFGVATTQDFGETWSFPWQEANRPGSNVDQGGWINPLLGPGWGENPLELGVSPTKPELCYATDMGRTLKSEDGGKTWKAVYTRQSSASGYTTTGLDVTTAYGVHFDPFDAKRMFISYTDIGLFRSDDGGVSWRSSAHGVPKAWSNTTYWVEFDPQVKGRLWAAMSGTHDLPRPKMWRRTQPERFRGGVCRSDDGGETWTTQTQGIPLTAATHILLDRHSPKNARVLYVTGFGRGVYKSSDGGASWSLKNNGLPAHEPFAWRLTQAGDGALYLVLARRSEDGSIGSDQDGALYRSRNGAENWEKVTLPEGVNGPNGLQVDPVDPKRLYLAAWGRKHDGGDTHGGIYLSTDAGASWKQVLNRDNHVYDVTIDPKNPAQLFACGFESSVWRSTDHGATWTRVPGYNFKWGHRVILDPVHPGSIFVTTFGGSVWHGPVAGDPAAGEDIVTPVVSYGGGKR